MCGLKFLLYREVEQTYGRDQRVITPELLNGWSVHNTGTTNIVLNQTDIIEPGASKTVGGNLGEIWDGQITMKFETPTPAPAVITNTAVFTFKYYQGIMDPETRKITPLQR